MALRSSATAEALSSLVNRRMRSQPLWNASRASMLLVCPRPISRSSSFESFSASASTITRTNLSWTAKMSSRLPS